ncbi:DNA primase [Candidatus Bathyarchaeota archaeon]|nr:DNA primase [Candidatus Bathyarchaeota archaeon]
MEKKDQYTGIKYNIIAHFVIEGIVEKHDVIGAIFGQTEGLFPKDFELRELQRSGKIGRIDIELKSANDKTTGSITVPSSLDKPETAVIAAAMETVDRVGPCEAKVTIESIRDVRVDKLKRIQERAKELMRDWKVKETHDIEIMLDQVSQEDKKVEPIHYGRERLTATPDISKRKDIIVVEGRADIINLLRAGISGAIAVEGVKIPKTVRDLANKMEITAFLDGDRGGDLILKELMQVAKPKYVARAPRGSEVEELDPTQIKAALAARVPVEEAVVPITSEYVDLVKELRGTLEAVLVGNDGKQISRFPVSELVDKLKQSTNIQSIVFDGIITGRLIDVAVEKKVKAIVGDRIAEGVRVPSGMEIKAFKDIS